MFSGSRIVAPISSIRRAPCRRSLHHGPDRPGTTGLPVQIDLLERYRSLVALGTITYNEDQIRVVMQLRRLQRELVDYAPPALPARHLHVSTPDQGAHEDNSEPWWKYTPDEETVGKDIRALVTHKGHAEEIASLTTPKGILLTGPPGAGKSFLIDLWYSTLPTRYKARKHYNQLVLEIYRSVWEETQRRMREHHLSTSANPDMVHHTSQGGASWNRRIKEQWQKLVRQNRLPTKWLRHTGLASSRGYTSDPTIAFVVAKRLMLKHWDLVFDEIQLLDVSSAGLLSDVLSWYWRMGGIVVGTSNKVPDDLYKNGVQRERLEPFVEALKGRCPVVELDVKRDWREEMSKMVNESLDGQPTWFTAVQTEDYGQYVKMLLDHQAGEPRSLDLNVFGRRLHVPWAQGRICRFTFDELCDESLGAADFLTLASTFSHVIITSIPVLPLSSKNQARRFISLIDALYESRCRLVCLADAVPESIFFPPEPGSSHQGITDLMLAESVTESQEYYRPHISSYDAPEMQLEVALKANDADVVSTTQPGRDGPEGAKASRSIPLDELSIFSGKDEQFAFKRALSRIQEMTSAAYNSSNPAMAQWTPLPADERKWETRTKGSEAPGQTPPTHAQSSPFSASPDRGPASATPGNTLSPSPREPHAQQPVGQAATAVHGHFEALQQPSNKLKLKVANNISAVRNTLSVESEKHQKKKKKQGLDSSSRLSSSGDDIGDELPVSRQHHHHARSSPKQQHEVHELDPVDHWHEQAQVPLPGSYGAHMRKEADLAAAPSESSREVDSLLNDGNLFTHDDDPYYPSHTDATPSTSSPSSPSPASSLGPNQPLAKPLNRGIQAPDSKLAEQVAWSAGTSTPTPTQGDSSLDEEAMLIRKVGRVKPGGGRDGDSEMVMRMGNEMVMEEQGRGSGGGGQMIRIIARPFPEDNKNPPGVTGFEDGGSYQHSATRRDDDTWAHGTADVRTGLAKDHDIATQFRDKKVDSTMGLEATANYGEHCAMVDRPEAPRIRPEHVWGMREATDREDVDAAGSSSSSSNFKGRRNPAISTHRD